MTPRSGLSLFELLVALALLAFVAAGLAGAMNIAISVWIRSAALSAAAEEVALRSRLRVWLAQATPPRLLTPFPATLLGGPDRIEFTTLAETPFAPDAAALRVTVAQSDDALTMIALAIDDEGEEIARYGGPLASNIVARFSYYNDASDPPTWQDTWDDTARLPALVRIHAPDGSVPNWPEFTVRPALQ